MHSFAHDASAQTASPGPPYVERLEQALPNLFAAHQQLYRSLWQQAHVPPAILELCRLRLAQLHRSEADWTREEHALAPGMREQLARWHESDAFDDAARACIAFAEVYAMDASAISDAQAQAVQSHFGDAGLVLLIEALGLFDGMTRLNLLWRSPPAAQGDHTTPERGEASDGQ